MTKHYTQDKSDGTTGLFQGAKNILKKTKRVVSRYPEATVTYAALGILGLCIIAGVISCFWSPSYGYSKTTPREPVASDIRDLREVKIITPKAYTP